MKCWICGDEAQTGEHLIKASDMRAIFGQVRQTKPLYLHTASRRNFPAKGINIGAFKSTAMLCQRCNNERTQVHDRAWETLSRFLRGKRSVSARPRIDLAKVFPGAVRQSMLRVHLFFVKLFGCLIAENSVPIDLRPFAAAILNGTAHPDVHLAISSYVDGVASGSAGYSDLDAAQLNGQIVFAVWMYVLDRFSVRVMYAVPGEHRHGLIDSWHPSTVTKCIHVSRF